MNNQGFENQHPRDREGRFATKPAAGVAAESEVVLGLPSSRQLDADQFYDEFGPQESPSGSNFWELSQVQDRGVPDERVWTVIDSNDGTGRVVAMPGYHLINRVGHMVTEKPWTADVLEAVVEEGSKPYDDADLFCDECGEQFFVSDSGTAHHWGDGPDDVDHDLDADHVPYMRD